MSARRLATAPALLLATLLTAATATTVGVATGAAQAEPAARTAAPTSARADVGGSLAITPANPIEYELTRFKGRMITKLKRPVQLQVATKKGAFKTVSLSGTNPNGRYSFREIVQPRGGVTRVRVLAPRHRVGITTYPAITSAVVRISVLTQAAALSVPAPATAGKPFTVIANLTPVREGRAVQVQRLDGSTWTTVASGVEDASGVFTTTLTEPTAGPRTYRTFAPVRRGAKAVTSDPFTVTVGPAA